MIMYFKKRSESYKRLRMIKGDEKVLAEIMHCLFYEDNYVFEFDIQPKFEVYSPTPRSLKNV